MDVYPRHADRGADLPHGVDDTADLVPIELGGSGTGAGALAGSPAPGEVDLTEDPFADDLSEQLDAVAPRQWVSRTTVVLAALVLLIGGFVAGAQVQKHWGTSAPSSTAGNNPFAGLAGGGFSGGGFAGRNGVNGGTGGNGANAGGGGGATTGTVKLVDGTTVYITTPSGQTVIVKTTGTTTVETSQPGSLKDLTAGSTVTIQGQTAGDGSMTATRITKTK